MKHEENYDCCAESFYVGAYSKLVAPFLNMARVYRTRIWTQRDLWRMNTANEILICFLIFTNSNYLSYNIYQYFHLPIILNPSESLLWFVAQPSNLFFPKCKGELLNFLLLVKLTIFYDLFLSGLTLFPFYPCLCVWVKVGLTFRFPWDLLLETEEVYVKVVWYNLSW